MSAQRKAGKGVPTPAFETSDVSPWTVLTAVGILFGAVALSIVLVLGFLFLIEPTAPDILPARKVASAAPRLEVSPAADRARIQANAASRLDDYGWTDPTHQFARIPIGRAMTVLSTKGWPDSDDNPGAKP